ncbi:MAG TPA: hypothetical protein VFM71_01890 [Gemmatimonadaceae bacterium]|nr:hypothetical protein [Gemmatimonadaceae bacterium]
MTDAPRATAGLAEILGERALRAGSSRLTADIIVGTLIVAVAVWLRPAAWVLLLSAGACLMAYGAWAFAVRRLSAEAWRMPPGAENGWRALRAAGAFVGVAAFVLLLISLLGTMLGPLIS